MKEFDDFSKKMWFLFALLFDLKNFLPFVFSNDFAFVFYSFGMEVTFSNHIAAKLKNTTSFIILLCLGLPCFVDQKEGRSEKRWQGGKPTKPANICEVRTFFFVFWRSPENSQKILGF